MINNRRTRTAWRAWIGACAVFFLSLGAAYADTKPKQGNPMVTMTTNYGVIRIEVLADKAPITAQNFVEYIAAGFYDGLIFHRVIPDFVIQGGGFEPGMKRKTTRAPIQNEADNGVKNARGTLSMARTSDPQSATSQFFINLKDNVSLDHTGKNPRGWGYAVFAKVVSGLDVVDKISQVETGTVGPYRDVPRQDVVITTVAVDP